jgi:hypothetical protein
MQNLHNIDDILSCSVAQHRCSEEDYSRVMESVHASLREWELHTGETKLQKDEHEPTLYAEMVYRVAYVDTIAHARSTTIRFREKIERISMNDVERADGKPWTLEAFEELAKTVSISSYGILKRDDVTDFLITQLCALRMHRSHHVIYIDTECVSAEINVNPYD